MPRWQEVFHSAHLWRSKDSWCSADLKLVSAWKWIILLCTVCQRCGGDISFPMFSRDPDGTKSHMTVFKGSEINAWSTEFVEICPSWPYDMYKIEKPSDTMQTFQFYQWRIDAWFWAGNLTEMKYLHSDQLDNPYSGNVSQGNHTQVIPTYEFIPDGDLLPVPHHRYQVCHFGLRLTPPTRMVLGTASYYRFKQSVAYGFETEFHFRIMHHTKECIVAGEKSEWCTLGGADGFAFVVQNEGAKAVGEAEHGMGYGFQNCLAIEFDTYRDSFEEDLNGNHISVHISDRPGKSNSASHYGFDIGHADDIGDLREGLHHVRIVYDVRNYNWDDMLDAKMEADISEDVLELHSSGRVGILTVELDKRRVLSTPVDLAKAARVDGMDAYQADPPTPPSAEAYDYGGAMPGRAWVGFTSSTGIKQVQATDILSWTFKEKPRCPGEGDILCTIDPDWKGYPPYCRHPTRYCMFKVRNAGRQPIKVSARYKTDHPHEAHECQNSLLEWDQLHPYFLGCQKGIYYPSDLRELWINTLDGARVVRITDQDQSGRIILNKFPLKFKRRSPFEYCVKEHNHDLTRLYFAECNCEYCTRLFTLQFYYSIFWQQECTARYDLYCPCFEVSEMTNDASLWNLLPPMTFMRTHICRGCVYTSQCTVMLKAAMCEPAYQTYVIGNPLAPVPLYNGFTNMSRDEGRVMDGRLRGDACICEPEYQAFGEGSGNCARSALLEKLPNHGAIDDCFQKCKDTNNCNYFAVWESIGSAYLNQCALYSSCDWLLCSTYDIECLDSKTFQMAALGAYADTRQREQRFKVYLLRTVQTTYDQCFECLSLYDEIHCSYYCGPVTNITYLHYPAGQGCATCMFAGSRMYELTQLKRDSVKACVYEAIRQGSDPWVACDETAKKESSMGPDDPGHGALDLFNGVGTHFLTECPGRPFETEGAVCVPNVQASEHFESQILSMMSAINNTVWTMDQACINAMCNAMNSRDCYWKLARWTFDSDLIDSIAGIPVETFHGAYLDNGALVLNKTLEQYAITGFLPFPINDMTLEIWTTVGEIERIHNIALNVPTETNTRWREDYLPELAVDGDMTTYWSSQVGEPGEVDLQATWTVDLNWTAWAGGLTIHWMHHPADFHIMVSEDNVKWTQIYKEKKNDQTTTIADQFFRARWVSIIMTRAAVFRPQGPGEGRPVYSIKEFVVNFDRNLARLKPTNMSFTWHRPVTLAMDSDFETYWSTPPNTPTAYVLLDFGSVITDVNLVKITWRLLPNMITIFRGNNACSETSPPTTVLLTASGGGISRLTEILTRWSGRCLFIRIDETREENGEKFARISEIAVYSIGPNLAKNASIVSIFPKSDGGNYLTPANLAMDGSTSTYWHFNPIGDVGAAELVIDLGSLVHVLIVEVAWGIIGGLPYIANDFQVYGGPDKGFAEEEAKHVVEGSGATSHRFVGRYPARFMKLLVQRTAAINPSGQLAVAEFAVYASSTDVAQRNTTTPKASAEWANCPTCYIQANGSTRLHVPSLATDGDLDSWWGGPFGDRAAAQEELIWTVNLGQIIAVDVALVKWKFRATQVSVWCSATGDTNYIIAGYEYFNQEFITPVLLTASPFCGYLRFQISGAVDLHAKDFVIGIREVQVYSFTNNLALNKLVTVGSDGGRQDNPPAFAVDASQTSTWLSWPTTDPRVGGQPIVMTIDLAGILDFWLIAISWSYMPKVFKVHISLDGATYTEVRSFLDNSNNDVWVWEELRARFIQIEMIEPAAGRLMYGMFSLRVFTGPNLALGTSAVAERGWDHSGLEAVDGKPLTFFLSEPGSTSSWLEVDLLEDYFVADNVVITWKFPAEEFDVLISQNRTSWETLKIFRQNERDVIEIEQDFSARYIAIHMLRPSPKNGAGAYAIYSIDVWFDLNLCHGKKITADDITKQTRFDANMSIDGDFFTFWMPEQNSDHSEVMFDLQEELVVSGMKLQWRFPPLDFRIEQYDPYNGYWAVAGRWRQEDRDDFTLEHFLADGFPTQHIKLIVTEAEVYPEGRQVALREVTLYHPGPKNLAGRKESSALASSQTSGSPASLAVDSNTRGTYWNAGEQIRWGWLEIDLAQDYEIAQISIWWRRFVSTFIVELRSKTNAYFTVYTESNQTNLQTHLYLIRTGQFVRVQIINTTQDIGIFEVKVHEAFPSLPPAAKTLTPVWKSPVSNVIDRDMESYWMSSPAKKEVTIYIDLGRVYYTGGISLQFGYLAQAYELFVSLDGNEENEIRKGLTSDGKTWGLVHVSDKSVFAVRHLRLFILRPYEESKPETQFATTLKDINVFLFQNLAFRQVAVANSIWDYEPQWLTDGNDDTYWAARLGLEDATVVVDLKQMTNIAGIRILFMYVAYVFVLHWSIDGVMWHQIAQKSGNHDLEINLPPDGKHFRARYVNIRMTQPKDEIYHPDYWGKYQYFRRVLGLRELQIFEHTGGGGLMGLQSPDGMIYNTITYAQRQPSTWGSGSESDKRTQEVVGIPEQVGNKVQIVVTYRSVPDPAPTAKPGNQATEVAIYRDGMPYGKSYIYGDFVNFPNTTRLVFGVRSTAYVDGTAGRIQGVHGTTHSPYYDGRIHLATLLKGALIPEEVKGLYDFAKGGQELGCHCYDACPVGSTKFFPSIPVPCSGSGVCLRDSKGQPFGKGKCQCLPGYSGEACQHHCSELSRNGCCHVDDDCESGATCNQVTKACSV